ncbi:alpha/beta hydrolase [Thalassotalea litorea]|uniref:Alpha/beta hydrolase n=1 Tax=Thalassotalea litorea TaxID=2020715 RepID=A0A5R9IN05_9GAMM|nr:alpha/beta hydrolase [Thalassotalea litorea]TLU66915.1 alpha/beta hydrolase [Thalassotalea litorea]
MNPKPLLVFLPGTLCTGAIFSPFKNHPSFDAIIIDFNLEDSLEDMVNTVLKRVVTRPFIAVGFSMGGMVAFELMRKVPAQITGLILLNSNSLADNNERYNGRQHQLNLARQHGIQYLFQDVMLPVFFANPDSEPGQQVVAMANELGIKTFEAQHKVLTERPDSMALLKTFNKPALVIGAEYDLPCPVEHQQQMADALVQGQLHILKQCGHFAVLEQPQTILDIIDHWIEQNYG